jgi:hypothetical protein
MQASADRTAGRGDRRRRRRLLERLLARDDGTQVVTVGRRAPTRIRTPASSTSG